MHKKIFLLALITAGILMIPLVAMQFYPEDVVWTTFDFIFAGVAIFVAGLAYLLISQNFKNTSYKFAVALGLLGAFLLLWANGAVGIIGDEGNPVNAFYFIIHCVGFFGGIATRFKPTGMSYVMFSVAGIQMLIPLIALIMVRPVLEEAPGIIGVFILNAGFAALFAGSGMLFRQSIEK